MPLLRSGDVKIYSPAELEAMVASNGFSGVSATIKENIQVIRGER